MKYNFCSHDDVSAYAAQLDVTLRQVNSLKKFFGASLKRLKLQNHHDVIEVFSEVYLRRKSSLEAGKSISYPYSWSKKAGWNYLLGEKDKLVRARPCAPDVLDNKAGTNCTEIVDSTVYLSAGAFQPKHLQAVFDKLPSMERRLFELKYIHEWSWQQVTHHLREQEPHLTEVAVRQRGHKLKQKLRKLILSGSDKEMFL